VCATHFGRELAVLLQIVHVTHVEVTVPQTELAYVMLTSLVQHVTLEFYFLVQIIAVELESVTH
jgi:hypothetical protein